MSQDASKSVESNVNNARSIDKGKGRARDIDEMPREEPSVVDDLIAGWIGGAVGILASQ